jgi:hypothetical protein
MTNKAEVYFALKGEDFNPDSFTEASHLTPTESWKKGEKGKHVNTYKFSYWEIGIEAVEGEVILVDEMAEKLVTAIKSKKKVIREYVNKHDLYSVLEVVLHISTNDNLPTPALGFKASTIEFLNYVKAEIDVDIYRN